MRCYMISLIFMFAIAFLVVGSLYCAYKLVSGFSQFIKAEKNQ
jgi:hypothetical protein